MFSSALHHPRYSPYAPTKAGEDVKFLVAHVKGRLSVGVRVSRGNKDLDELFEYNERETPVQYVVHHCVQISQLREKDRCYVYRVGSDNNLIPCYVIFFHLYVIFLLCIHPRYRSPHQRTHGSIT